MSVNPFDTRTTPSLGNFTTFIPLFLILVVFIGVANSFEMNGEQSNTKNIQIIVPDNQRFKQLQIPDNGIVRLIKGKIKVTHHSIKEDSVIMVNRKNIEGKPGFHLLISIEPNESFTIKSVDDEGTVETEDYGEVFFKIY